jgi:AcrR family transcriptional regulator
VSTHPKLDGRRERSRRTRRRIIDAAANLFVARGYLATTIEDIAAAAGVAVQTVYYVFGTKTNLLAAVLDSSIGGDVEPISVLERAWVESLRSEPEATVAIQRLVEATVAILARTAPIYEVVRRAAADPDVTTLLDDTRRRRRQDQRRLIEILQRSGHLHPDVSSRAAADVVYAVMNEEVFQLFTRDCGWSVDQFRGWARNFMLHQLIEGGASQRPPGRAASTEPPPKNVARSHSRRSPT